MSTASPSTLTQRLHVVRQAGSTRSTRSKPQPREGAKRVEFLGGADRYKVGLSDRFEPLYEGFGLPGSLRGAAAARARVGAIQLRKTLKRSEALRHFYFDGLAPARRLLGRLT